MTEAEPQEIQRRFALLEQVELLFALPQARIRSLARAARGRLAAPEEIIIREGDRGEHVYVIVDGECEVRTSTGPGQSMATALLHRADLFGISALTPADPHFASVIARSQTELLELERPDLFSAIASVPEVLADVMRAFNQRRLTMEQLINYAAAGQPDGAGKVVAIYATKGGAGKTTLAINLGSLVARGRPGEVGLLDLGLPFNHAALLSGLVPEHPIAQLDASRPGFEDELLSSILRHPCGLMVLAGVTRVEQSELITGDVVTKALAVLKQTFQLLVVDLGGALTEPCLRVLERADVIVLVVTPEVSSIKDTREVIKVLTGILKVPLGRMRVVLNHPRDLGKIARPSIERALGLRITIELPFDGPKLDRAALKGDLIAVSDPASRFARGCEELAEELVLAGIP